VSIDLTEGRHLVWWKNYLAQAPLAGVGNVLGIDKQAVLAQRLFAKYSQRPKRFGSKAISQKLAARVIGFYSSLKARLFFKKATRN